jgi:hypothetical protein
MGPRAGLDAVAKRKDPFLVPIGNRTPVVQPVAQTLCWLSYPGFSLTLFHFLFSGKQSYDDHLVLLLGFEVPVRRIYSL